MENKQISLIVPADQNIEKPHLFMGILCIASYLAKKNFNVKIYDEQLNEASKNIDEILKKSFLVGFTVMTSQIKSAYELSKIVHKKGIPVIWGGIHPTLFAEQCLKEDCVDFVAYDEGEETLFEIAKYLADHSSKIEQIRGIYFKDENGKIIRNSQREYIDINEVSSNWDLVNLNNYDDLTQVGKKFIKTFPIHVGRGCPYSCTFCINTLLNKRKWRGISEENITREIKNILNKVKLECVDFVDENFFIDIDRVKKFCEVYQKEKFNFLWIANARLNYLTPNHIDDNLLVLLRDCGCLEVRMGIESGSQNVLDKIINKGIKKEDVLPVLERLHKFKINAACSFMIGMPNEKIKEQKETLKLIKQILKQYKNVRVIGPQLYRPYPGAEMYAMAKQLGFKEPQDTQSWIQFLNETGFIDIRILPWISNRNELKNVYKYYTYSQIKPRGFLAYFLGISFKNLFKLRMALNFYKFNFDIKLYEKMKKIFIKTENVKKIMKQKMLK